MTHLHASLFRILSVALVLCGPVAPVLSCAAPDGLSVPVPEVRLVGPYYVDPINGNDTNDGSSGAPWRSLTHAAANAPGGAVVYVLAGTLSPTATGEQFPITRSQQWTVLASRSARLDGEGTSSDLIQLTAGADGSYMDHLGFQNTTGGSFAVRAVGPNPPTDLTLASMDFRNVANGIAPGRGAVIRAALFVTLVGTGVLSHLPLDVFNTTCVGCGTGIRATDPASRVRNNILQSCQVGIDGGGTASPANVTTNDTWLCASSFTGIQNVSTSNVSVDPQWFGFGDYRPLNFQVLEGGDPNVPNCADLDDAPRCDHDLDGTATPAMGCYENNFVLLDTYQSSTHLTLVVSAPRNSTAILLFGLQPGCAVVPGTGGQTLLIDPATILPVVFSGPSSSGGLPFGIALNTTNVPPGFQLVPQAGAFVNAPGGGTVLQLGGSATLLF